MDEPTVNEVVAQLRQRGVFAHVERAGVYQFGVRVVIPDGREAIWDTDGAAGLEATIMRDGVLVGFVPTLPDSTGLDVAETVARIAATDYDAVPGSAPRERTAPTAPRPAVPPPPRQGLLRRLRGR